MAAAFLWDWECESDVGWIGCFGPVDLVLEVEAGMGQTVKYFKL